MKRVVEWILALFPAFVFGQSLPFKFTGAPETQHIFTTIGNWFGSIGVDAIAAPFSAYGAYVVGTIEAIAMILLIIPKTRHIGALLGLAALSGAIFFHVATPLGINVTFPGSETGDPTLFIMAVIGVACCAATLYLNIGRITKA